MILGSLVKSQNYPSSLQLLNNQLPPWWKKTLNADCLWSWALWWKAKATPLSTASKQATPWSRTFGFFPLFAHRGSVDGRLRSASLLRIISCWRNDAQWAVGRQGRHSHRWAGERGSHCWSHNLKVFSLVKLSLMLVTVKSPCFSSFKISEWNHNHNCHLNLGRDRDEEHRQKAINKRTEQT